MRMPQATLVSHAFNRYCRCNFDDHVAPKALAIALPAKMEDRLQTKGAEIDFSAL